MCWISSWTHSLGILRTCLTEKPEQRIVDNWRVFRNQAGSRLSSMSGSSRKAETFWSPWCRKRNWCYPHGELCYVSGRVCERMVFCPSGSKIFWFRKNPKGPGWGLRYKEENASAGDRKVAFIKFGLWYLVFWWHKNILRWTIDWHELFSLQQV